MVLDSVTVAVVRLLESDSNKEFEVAVVKKTTSPGEANLTPFLTGDDVLRFQAMVKKVPVAEDLVRYAVRLVSASRPTP